MIAVDSEMMDAVDYDAARRRLGIRFISGGWYWYAGVPCDGAAEHDADQERREVRRSRPGSGSSGGSLRRRCSRQRAGTVDRVPSRS